MKAYKATYNMKCLEQTYAVGETYTHEGKIELCRTGFHFCKKAIDTLNYYSCKEDFILLEIEVTGDVQTVDDKSVTDQFSVIRIVPREEYAELLFIYFHKKGIKKGKLKKQISPSGRIYLYDDKQNVIKEITPKGKVYKYTYDKNNNKIKAIPPNGNVHTWEYDKNRNVIRSTVQTQPRSLTRLGKLFKRLGEEQ